MATEHNAQARGDAPLEKDFSTGGANGYHQNGAYLNDTNMDNDTALKRIRTAGSISISPELFEKIYLSPQNAVKGDLRKTFGNPTPVALLGFLVSLTPLSCDLMGWRGAGGSGAASEGAYFFFGGLLMIIGGFLEFIVGNTFPFVVFSSFGAYWLTFAATLQPVYNAYGAYAPAGSASAAAGLATPAFNASFGFFLLTMGFLCLLYLILSLRTNVVFFIIFLTLLVAFCLLTGAYWNLAEGNADKANTLIITAGAFLFITCAAGWWIFFAIMLAALDFPIQLPVGDLSTVITGASARMKEKENMA